jgi:hypothetical protein
MKEEVLPSTGLSVNEPGGGNRSSKNLPVDGSVYIVSNADFAWQLLQWTSPGMVDVSSL